MIKYLLSNPAVLTIFIGSVIVAIGTLWYSYTSAAEADKTTTLINEISKKQKIIDNNQKELVNQQNIVAEKQTRIEDLQDQNFKLSQGISQQAMGISDYQTGKGSYAYVLLFPKGALDPAKQVAEGFFALQGIGTNPLLNLSISVIKSDEWKVNPKRKFGDDLSQIQISLSIYTPKGEGDMMILPALGSYPMNKTESIHFSINFISGTRIFNEWFVTQYITNEWEWAIYIKDETNSFKKLLFSTKFPTKNESAFEFFLQFNQPPQ